MLRDHNVADDAYDSLLEALDEALGRLRRAGETHWQRWLQRGRDQVASGDANGIDHLLSAFGGMGSFNDLTLSQPGSDQAWLREADDRLWDLRDSIWRDCKTLKRALA